MSAAAAETIAGEYRRGEQSDDTEMQPRCTWRLGLLSTALHDVLCCCCFIMVGTGSRNDGLLGRAWLVTAVVGDSSDNIGDMPRVPIYLKD